MCGAGTQEKKGWQPGEKGLETRIEYQRKGKQAGATKEGVRTRRKLLGTGLSSMKSPNNKWEFPAIIPYVTEGFIVLSWMDNRAEGA